MQRFTDRQYLTREQYKDSSNLDARVAIHVKFSTNPQGWLIWLFDELLELSADARILELGCGPAYLWKENADRIPPGWDITLSDLSAGMVDAAWRNLVVSGRAYNFREIDAQEIPFEDKTFDAVIANHMLYHVPDRKQALKEIRRVLKNDGSLFTTTVGENHMREMWNWLDRASGGERDAYTFSFTLENGREQLQEFFPRVEMTRYSDDLRVTDVSTIMAYIRSMTSTADFQEDEFQSIERELVETMRKNGEIFIAKDSGLFKAKN